MADRGLPFESTPGSVVSADITLRVRVGQALNLVAGQGDRNRVGLGLHELGRRDDLDDFGPIADRQHHADIRGRPRHGLDVPNLDSLEPIAVDVDRGTCRHRALAPRTRPPRSWSFGSRSRSPHL